MDAGHGGTPKAGVSPQLRETEKKENQAGIGTILMSSSALISLSNKPLLVEFL